MACAVAEVRPAPPVIAMDAQVIGRTPAEPNCEAGDGTPCSTGVELAGASSSAAASVGRNGVRGSATPIVPTPGPTLPRGMVKVLCRFKCETSPPNLPG